MAKFLLDTPPPPLPTINAKPLGRVMQLDTPDSVVPGMWRVIFDNGLILCATPEMFKRLDLEMK